MIRPWRMIPALIAMYRQCRVHARSHVPPGSIKQVVASACKKCCVRSCSRLGWTIRSPCRADAQLATGRKSRGGRQARNVNRYAGRIARFVNCKDSVNHTRLPILFIPQCVDGFHPGCCASRVDSEEDSDSNGETDSKKDRRTSYRCRRKSGNDKIRAKNTQHNPQYTS